jgi:hypothetical protein
LQFVGVGLVVLVALLRLVVLGLWFGFRAIACCLVGGLGASFLVVLCGGGWGVCDEWVDYLMNGLVISITRSSITFTAYPGSKPLIK